MWNLQNKINEHAKLIGTENKLMIARQERVWGLGGKKGKGINKYKLAVTKQSG